MEKSVYSPPTLEVFEVEIEKGFAQSSPIDGWRPGYL